jgi:hypothetical protein
MQILVQDLSSAGPSTTIAILVSSKLASTSSGMAFFPHPVKPITFGALTEVEEEGEAEGGGQGSRSSARTAAAKLKMGGGAEIKQEVKPVKEGKQVKVTWPLIGVMPSCCL